MRRALPVVLLLLAAAAVIALLLDGPLGGGPAPVPTDDAAPGGDDHDRPPEVSGPAAPAAPLPEGAGADRRTPALPDPDVGTAAAPPPGAAGDRRIEGRVLGADGRAVEGAKVEVVRGVAAPASAQAPAPARSLADGAFLLEAVPSGAARVRASHPAYVDGEAAVDPGTARLTFTLSPALVAWFRVVTPDGRAPEEVVATATSGRFHRVQALTRPDDPEAAAPQEGLLGPLKVPADTGAEVLFEVRVPGHQRWTIDDEAPARGGARVYEVRLVRTPDQGRARLRLRTEEGEVVEYGGTPPTTASVERLDGPPTGRPVPRAAEGDAVFDDLPPGRWRVTVVARGRAPATAEFDVRANEETAVEARFGPEARAKVRLVAPRGRKAQVRLTRGERPAHVFLDGTADAGVTSFFAGEEGVVVGGLAPGPYVVEVLSPDLAAIGARFEAVAGRTTEVEVRPTPR